MASQDKSQTLSSETSSDLNHSNIAFTKAAFAFKDGLDRAHARKQDKTKSSTNAVTVTTIPVPTPSEKQAETAHEPDSEQLADLAHQARHKRRIRIARGVQHTLTSLLSLAVAILQGQTYLSYQKTKDVKNAWPTYPNLLPTLMLLATAVAALFIDICAIVAYLWPQKRAGQRAYSLAVTAHYVITAIKGVSYSFSTIVCKAGFNQGNSSGQNNDLWSWSCKVQQDNSSVASVINAGGNCAGSNIAWILAIANIVIEVFGLVIDQLVKRDQERWGKDTMSNAPVAPTSVESTNTATSATMSSDNEPLLPKFKGAGRRKYEKLTDDQENQLDAFRDESEKDLRSNLPDLKVQQS